MVCVSLKSFTTDVDFKGVEILPSSVFSRLSPNRPCVADAAGKPGSQTQGEVLLQTGNEPINRHRAETYMSHQDIHVRGDVPFWFLEIPLQTIPVYEKLF